MARRRLRSISLSATSPAKKPALMPGSPQGAGRFTRLARPARAADWLLNRGSRHCSLYSCQNDEMDWPPDEIEIHALADKVATSVYGFRLSKRNADLVVKALRF